MATGKNHSEVKEERKKRETYIEQPGEVPRAPSELALGTSKAGSCPKQQGNKGTGAFPQVSFPLHGSKAWLMAPLAASGQGREAPTFKATIRTRIGSHKHQRFFVCSAPTWSVKPPRRCWCWRQSPGQPGKRTTTTCRDLGI